VSVEKTPSVAGFMPQMFPSIGLTVIGGLAGIVVATLFVAPLPLAFGAEAQGYREVGASITGASEIRAGSVKAESPLGFESSDAALAAGFTWAKRQAMAFVYEGDPVGPWYEAAEPGREAFCMRDVAHQAMGAHALGLARHNRNMLHHFAEAVTDARDWCSFWEIDRYDRPAPVDYRNDAEFWYNLPANFDVLDACDRMYIWTGDQAYVDDPAFLNYYERTVRDYVERWGLGPGEVMKRPRLLNVRGMLAPGVKKFQANRGIPGYNEQDPGFVLGADVLATQYAGYRAYAHLQAARGNEDAAREILKRAADVKALINTEWWNEAGQHFYGWLDKDHTLAGKAGSGLLYRDVVDAAHIPAALGEGRAMTEVQYRYGDADKAYAQMIDIAQGTGSRREYPEVPYSWLGTLVNGTMGITLDARSALESRTEGFWVATVVQTLSGLGTRVAWAEMRNLPVRANEITVRHDGTRKTALTNQHGPALLWRAAFAGTHETLLVNGRPVKAKQENGLSFVRVTLGGGGTITVQVP
jgi:hypothetical protein